MIKYTVLVLALVSICATSQAQVKKHYSKPLRVLDAFETTKKLPLNLFNYGPQPFTPEQFNDLTRQLLLIRPGFVIEPSKWKGAVLAPLSGLANSKSVG